MFKCIIIYFIFYFAINDNIFLIVNQFKPYTLLYKVKISFDLILVFG